MKKVISWRTLVTEKEVPVSLKSKRTMGDRRTSTLERRCLGREREGKTKTSCYKATSPSMEKGEGAQNYPGREGKNKDRRAERGMVPLDEKGMGLHCCGRSAP